MSIGEALPVLTDDKGHGAARYTADVHVPNMLYGVLVTASIPAGKVTGSTRATRLRKPASFMCSRTRTCALEAR